MFTNIELVALEIALDKEIASQRRAINTSKQPQFKALAEKLCAEFEQLRHKVVELKNNTKK